MKILQILLVSFLTLIIGCQVPTAEFIKTVDQAEVRFHNMIIEMKEVNTPYPYTLPYGVRLGETSYGLPLKYNQSTGWLKLYLGVNNLELGGPNGTWTTGQGQPIDSRTWGGKRIKIILIGTSTNWGYQIIEE